MYKIIGGDHREYGPATAEELRRWIAEGRLSGQSLVQAEGTGQWKPVSAYPELADALRAQARSAPEAGVAAPVPDAAAWSADLRARRPEVRIGECLALSWDLLRDNFGLLLGATFLVWSIETLCQYRWSTGLFYMLLQGVLYGGLSMVFLNRIRGEPAAVTDVFAGFRVAFGQLLLVGFISHLLTFLAGLCFLIVPGIYLFVAWLFSVPLVIDKRLEFWSAMETSRRVVTRAWFEVFALFLIALLPTLAMGVFIQGKVAVAMLPMLHGAFPPGAPPDFGRLSELLNQAGQTARITPMLQLASRLVFLVNLPFALGALLHAYENLFGTRRAPTP